MKTASDIFRIALLVISAIFLTSNLSWGQDNPLELIEGSEDILLDGKTGNWIVRGNVRLVKDDTKMFCDSAYYNPRIRFVKAYGNVHINKQDTLNMFCDSLHYNLKTEFAKLWGNVRVRDNEYKLVTDSLDFDAKKNVGIYRNGGVTTSITSNEKLTSKVGYFYTETKYFFFSGDVVYINEDQKITTDTLKFNELNKKAFFFGPTHIYDADGVMYCEKGWYNTGIKEGVLQQNAYIDREKEYLSGDSLYYNDLEGLSIGKGNVIIRDTTNKIEFTGDFARNSEKEKKGFITGHALAKRFEDKDDTLFIHADTLYNFLDSLNESRLILAYNNVKLFKSDMQGVCDSLSYDRVVGEMNMYHDPLLWAKNAQLSGDSISIFEKDGDIRRAFLRNNGLVVTEVDTSKNYFNQIAGKTMNAFFDSTEIRRLDIEGNAKTIFFMEEEDEKDSVIMVNRSGMNRIYSSNLSFYFDGGEIKTAVYRETPDGMMYPMDKIDKKEQNVDGFKWDNSRRPISWQTMILTDEEFKKWKEKESLKKSLLDLAKYRSLTTRKEHDEAKFAYSYVSKYAEENLRHLNFLLSEENDSISVVKDSIDWQSRVNEIKSATDYLIGYINEELFTLLQFSKVKNIAVKRDTLKGIITNFDSFGKSTKLKDSSIFKQYVSATKKEDSLKPLILSHKDSVANYKKIVATYLPSFPTQKPDSIKVLKPVNTIDSLHFAVADTLQDLGKETITDSTDTLTHVSVPISFSDSLDFIQSEDKDSIWIVNPPKSLEGNQIIAYAIDQLLSFEGDFSILKDSIQTTISYDSLLYEQRSLGELLTYFTSLTVDIKNVEREMYLYIIRKITVEKTAEQIEEELTEVETDQEENDVPAAEGD